MKERRGILLKCLSRNVYRVWDNEKKRVYETRHAIINEWKFPSRGVTRSESYITTGFFNDVETNEMEAELMDISEEGDKGE